MKIEHTRDEFERPFVRCASCSNPLCESRRYCLGNTTSIAPEPGSLTRRGNPSPKFEWIKNAKGKSVGCYTITSGPLWSAPLWSAQPMGAGAYEAGDVCRVEVDIVEHKIVSCRKLARPPARQMRRVQRG
jgi:hypothetical protein